MKKNVLHISLIVLMVLFLQINSFGLVCHNDLIASFSQTGSENIDKNMIDGAALFFKGNSYVNMYFAEYEKASGKDISFNYVAANEYLEKAIDILNQSLGKYNEAYNIGVRIGYAKEEIDKLKNFKYDSISYEFRNQKAFSDAVEFFKDGDVLGIYKKNLICCELLQVFDITLLFWYKIDHEKIL